jgi:hypothetical protein
MIVAAAVVFRGSFKSCFRSGDGCRARRWIAESLAVVDETNLGIIKAAVRTGGSFVIANG